LIKERNELLEKLNALKEGSSTRSDSEDDPSSTKKKPQASETRKETPKGSKTEKSTGSKGVQ
jgi:hypothetical protein